MIPLINKWRKKLHCEQKLCYICKKGFSADDGNKKYYKVRDHCHYTGKYRGAAHDIWNLRYKTPHEIPLVFHNGSTFDYHFIIKNLAKQFEGQFEFSRENTEKYKTFSLPIKKELDNCKTITYEIKFYNRFRFMSSSLLTLVDNLFEGLHNYSLQTVSLVLITYQLKIVNYYLNVQNVAKTIKIILIKI